MTDPDRFFDHGTPGSHEWWYFDALSDDGHDALVIIWYAGLPFDPSYGVGTLRHLRDPARDPAPKALDHSAIGFSWYRDGKTLAYALNGYRSDSFRYQADPFVMEVATSRVERDATGYLLTVATPAVDGRAIRVEIRFDPAGSTESFERDLGTPGAPHLWVLAAADCRVEGSVSAGDRSVRFQGRGYHDHNAGAEEMSLAMKRWEWGRVHHGPFTEVYYESSPRRGSGQGLWITCRDGRPEVIREGEAVLEKFDGRNVFGLRHAKTRRMSHDQATLTRTTTACLDDGPFYRRWLAEFRIEGSADLAGSVGISELLDTRNLNSRWFNWMIPYRLKWPRS